MQDDPCRQGCSRIQVEPLQYFQVEFRLNPDHQGVILGSRVLKRENIPGVADERDRDVRFSRIALIL